MVSVSLDTLGLLLLKVTMSTISCIGMYRFLQRRGITHFLLFNTELIMMPVICGPSEMSISPSTWLHNYSKASKLCWQVIDKTAPRR